MANPATSFTDLLGNGSWSTTQTNPDGTRTVQIHTNGRLSLVRHFSSDAPDPVIIASTEYGYELGSVPAS